MLFKLNRNLAIVTLKKNKWFCTISITNHPDVHARHMLANKITTSMFLTRHDNLF